jgi:hypothetical protein
VIAVVAGASTAGLSVRTGLSDDGVDVDDGVNVVTGTEVTNGAVTLMESDGDVVVMRDNGAVDTGVTGTSVKQSDDVCATGEGDDVVTGVTITAVVGLGAAVLFVNDADGVTITAGTGDAALMRTSAT